VLSDMRLNKDNLKWAFRMGAILLFVTGLDGVVVMFAARPMPWAAVIPALIPLLTALFVIIPMQGRQSRD